MIKLSLILLLLLPSLSLGATCTDCHASEFVNINEKVIEVAMKYKNVREKKNNNDDPKITEWLKFCYVGPGESYCAAYTVSMYKEAFESIMLKSPFPRCAGVARFAEYCVARPFDFKVISTKKINWGIEQPEVGDLLSWKHGSSAFTGFGYKGHQGLAISSNKNKTINTIEGNTKAGEGGDQSGAEKGNMKFGQEGVYLRTRSISINSKFPIVYYIRLNKRQYELPTSTK
jgi:hypothetical protein